MIDPRPIAGDPMYDLLFCLASDIKFLKEVDYINLVKIAKIEKKKLKILLLVVLYIRISIEKRHNKNDRVKSFEKIWNKVRRLNL